MPFHFRAIHTWLLLFISLSAIGQKTTQEGFARAQILMQEGNYDSVAFLLERSIGEYQQSGEKSKLAEAYFLYSQYYLRGSKFEQRLNSPKAYEMSKKAFDLYAEINDQQGIAKAKLNYGVLLNRLGDFEKSRDAYLESLSTFQIIKDSLGICQAEIRLGQIYGWEDRPFFSLDSSVYYFQNAISIAQSLEDEAQLAKTYNYAASSLIRKGYEAPTYLPEGLKAAQFAKEFYKENKSSFNYIIAYLNEGYAYEALGNTEKALAIAYDLLVQDLDVWTVSECYRLVYRTEKQLGNFKEALKYHELYKSTDDTVVRADTRRSVSKMESAFMELAKNKEISELEQTQLIQDLKLSQQKWLLFGLGTVLLMGGAGGFFYYQSFKNKKEKAEAELKQRFLRSQLNPHFIFNAIGAIQQYLFKFGAEKGSEYLGIFSKLMRQILEYSREEFIPLEDEIETLTNYLEVQKMRFEEQFSYSIEVDDDLEIDEAGVPPMFAQPVIENALEHGLFRNGAGENKIHIHFQKLGEDAIRLTIADTGTGFGNLQSEVKHNSLSSVITQERLNILAKHTHQKATYKANNLMNELGEIVGAKVEFQLPIKWI